MNDIRGYRAKRRALDITLEQIAKYCDVHLSYISKLERGDRPVSANPELMEKYQEYIDNLK